MRTRSTGRVSPEPENTNTLGSRRKRPAPTEQEDHELQIDNEDVTVTAPIVPGTPSTPKTAKRVRFSDSGPELMVSTGLTPFIRRATLSPVRTTSCRPPSPYNKRRYSLPPSLRSSSTGPLPSIEEVQFTPLKQVLNERVRRRLRRSHLSEELNDIEAEQRADSRVWAELQSLRGEDAKKEETIKQLLLDLELQRQFGIQVNAEEEQEIIALRAELEASRHGFPMAQVGDTHLDDLGDEPATSPWEEETFFSSPLRTGGEWPLSAGKSSLINDASCQTTLPDHDHENKIQEYEEAVLRLTQESTDAKASLAMIWSELRDLGLATDDENSEDYLQALRESFREARLRLEHMLPGETAGGIMDGKLLLESMVDHIKRLLGKQRESQKIIDRHQQIEAALRGQFNATLQKVANLEQKLGIVESHRTELIRELGFKGDEVRDSEQEIEDKAMELAECKQRISQLEAEIREQSISVGRLQAALATYRDEVTSLETLIARMDKDNTGKDADLADLRNDMYLAVAEREGMSQTLAKLREGVQESAFDLSALARPGLRENVTQRSEYRSKGAKRDSGIVMGEEGDEDGVDNGVEAAVEANQ